jgi:hypothetical protein
MKTSWRVKAAQPGSTSIATWKIYTLKTNQGKEPLFSSTGFKNKSLRRIYLSFIFYQKDTIRVRLTKDAINLKSLPRRIQFYEKKTRAYLIATIAACLRALVATMKKKAKLIRL